MPAPTDVYINCDLLDSIPKPNRDNYLYEIKLLERILPRNANVLQVGSMDGTRIIELLKVRPDLRLTGLEIEKHFIEIARKKIATANLKATFIHGDITQPQNLPIFDYVICLNNTLGYIPDQKKAIDGMKKLGKQVIISVFAEKFNDSLAREYFKSITLEVDKIENDIIITKDFTKIKRYTKEEIQSWSNDIHSTPLGYLGVISKVS